MGLAGACRLVARPRESCYSIIFLELFAVCGIVSISGKASARPETAKAAEGATSGGFLNKANVGG